MTLKSSAIAVAMMLGVSSNAVATNPEDGVPQFAIIDWFPFGWVERGRDKGMFVDMVDLYRKYLDRRLDAVIAPVPRVIRGMEEGEYDFTITYRDPGMLDVHYLADIGCLDSYIVSYKDNPVTSLEGLNGLRVAYPGGGYFAKRFLPDLDLDGVQVAQTFVMFRMALRRRLDAFIINDAVWYGYQNNLYPDFKVPAERWADFAPPVAIETLPLAVSVSPQSRHSHLGQAMTALTQSDAFMADMLKLYESYRLPNALGCLDKAKAAE